MIVQLIDPKGDEGALQPAINSMMQKMGNYGMCNG
jgi:hypothetical protein